MINFIVVIAAIVIVATIGVFVYLYVNKEDDNYTIDIGGGAPTAAGGSSSSTEVGFRDRIAGLGIISGTVLGTLLVRIWSMQLLSNDEYTTQAEENRTRTLTYAAPRGRILDRNGVELVSNRPCLTVTAESDVLDDAVEMQLLANLIGMPYLAVRRKIQDQTEGAQGPRTVASDVSRRVVSYISEHPYLFPAVNVEQRSQRRYPNGTMAAHVLGYTGSISRELLDWSIDHKGEDGVIAYESGDTVGQAGIEYQYESVLQGVRGEQIVYVDASGNVIENTTSVPPRSGSDVVLTIDAKVQRVAEESLANRIETLKKSFNKNCKAGSVVAMDVTNGEIIAMASYPTYNPTIFVGGISNADWERLSSTESRAPLLIRAISGQYPSGSSIKPLSTFAALDYGLADANTEYFCAGLWTGFGEAYGQYCWDKEGHGTMTLQTGITMSCDVVFYEVGKGFFSSGIDGLQETYRRWGLGQLTGIDLPSEEPGRVPDPEWKWNYWSDAPDDARLWQGGDSTNLAIGQGDILVSPLQMCCVYSGISQKGTQWRPHVLKSVASPQGIGSILDYETSVRMEVEEKPDYFELVKKGLIGVIYEESEAQASHFTNMKELIAGKTGTAEVAGVEKPHGWFIAYAPADNPKYAVAACVENGGFGSTNSLYIVRDVLGAIYDEPDDSTLVDSSGVR